MIYTVYNGQLEYIQLNQREKFTPKKKSVKQKKSNLPYNTIKRHLYRKSSAFETANNKKNIFNSKCVFC